MQGRIKAIRQAGEVVLVITGAQKTAYEQTVREAASAKAQFEAQAREIARLEAELTRLRDECQYQRERADRALDGLLATKGLPPVMPDVVSRENTVGDDPYAKEDPKEVAKMLKAMGLERTHAEA